jgi:ParB/RepB/Spo0J family partition protein
MTTLEAPAPVATLGYQLLPINLIRASAINPRRTFDEAKLEELACSIQEHGLLEPVVVRPVDEHYELIAGERRWRACVIAGKGEIPAIVREEMSDKIALELALIENLQRADLSAIEEAEGYRALHDIGGLTQQDIADRTGRSRPAIANAMRLLDLPEAVQGMICEGKLTRAHGVALLRWAKFPDGCTRLAELVIEQNVPTKDLDVGDGRIPWELRDRLKTHKTVISAPTYAYDDQWTCPRDCPNRIGELCFDRKEHTARKKAAKAEREAKEAKKLESARKAAEKKGQAPVLDEPPKNAVELHASREQPGYYYGSPIPTGCTEQCPCRIQAKARYSYGGKSDRRPYCTDPKRLEALIAEDKEREEAALNAECDALHDKAVAHCKTLKASDRRLWLLYVATQLLNRSDAGALKAAAAHISEADLKKSVVDAIQGGDLNRRLEFLGKLSPVELHRFVNDYILRESIACLRKKWNGFLSRSEIQYVLGQNAKFEPDPNAYDNDWEDEEERACRVCGCTDDYACDEGCEWVEDDLCSQCAKKEGETEFGPDGLPVQFFCDRCNMPTSARTNGLCPDCVAKAKVAV